jgi:NitT/TauT family transport system substrate-binding protein
MVSFLLSATAKTALSAFVGFLCAAVLGVLIGTTLASVRLLRVGVYPLANLLQMVPIIALAPLLNIWFGYGLAGVAAAACIVSIFPVIANTVDGLRSTDPQLVELFEVYGASRAQRWRRLELPAALPQIFTGLRIAAGLAVIGAVVGELVSGVLDDPPIGAVIATNLRTGRLEVVFASILGSASVGFGLFGVVSWAGERALGSWHASTQRARVDEVSTTPTQARTERSVLLIITLALVALTAWAWQLPAQGSDEARAQAQAQAQAQDTQARSATGEPIKVTLQLNWMPEPEFGGLYAAHHYGYDREEGLEIELVSGGPGVPSAQLIASGAVDFGVLGATQVVSMRAKGADLIALYASFQETPRVLMSHAEGAPESLEALWTSGRLMAIEPGSAFVRWLNHRYGAGGVRVVASQGGLSQFKQNKALTQAAYVFSEPVTLGLEGLPTKLYRVSESGWNPYEVVVAGREGYVKAHPERVQALVRAVKRGWAHYLRDPREVNALLARLNPAMSFEAMQAASRAAEPFVRGELTPSELTGELPLGEMSVERWRALSDQLKALGLVQRPDEPKRLFYRF